jgi:hypothetical protein
MILDTVIITQRTPSGWPFRWFIDDEEFAVLGNKNFFDI